MTEKWNKEILWGSTRNVTGLETVSMAKHTKGNNWNARSVLAAAFCHLFLSGSAEPKIYLSLLSFTDA